LSLQYGNGLFDLCNVLLGDKLLIMSDADWLVRQLGYQGFKDCNLG